MKKTYPTLDNTSNVEIRSRWYELVLNTDVASDFTKGLHLYLTSPA